MSRLEPPAWLSRAYFRWSIKRRISSYPNRIARHRYADFELSVSIEDPVAEEWYDHDWPLTPELRALQGSRLEPGARVFDLGAHQAVVALILSRLVGPSGEVIALEAERHNFEVAQRNRELNGAANLTVIHAAAAAESGSLSFTGGLNGNVVRDGGVGASHVRAASVDALAERHGSPDVVFVDVEGFEHEVLRGAAATLAQGGTDFFVEVHVGYGLEDLGGSAGEVIEHFDPDRFTLLVSRARGELEPYDFAPLEARSELLSERFFLVALAR